jgi:hypothetical protein
VGFRRDAEGVVAVVNRSDPRSSAERRWSKHVVEKLAGSVELYSAKGKVQREMEALSE